MEAVPEDPAFLRSTLAYSDSSCPEPQEDLGSEGEAEEFRHLQLNWNSMAHPPRRYLELQPQATLLHLTQQHNLATTKAKDFRVARVHQKSRVFEI